MKMILIQDGSQNTNVDKPLRIIGEPYKVQVSPPPALRKQPPGAPTAPKTPLEPQKLFSPPKLTPRKTPSPHRKHPQTSKKSIPGPPKYFLPNSSCKLFFTQNQIHAA